MLLNFLIYSLTWIASSRVGSRIIAWTSARDWGSSLAFSRKSSCRGKRNASVFPEPVLDLLKRFVRNGEFLYYLLDYQFSAFNEEIVCGFLYWEKFVDAVLPQFATGLIRKLIDCCIITVQLLVCQCLYVLGVLSIAFDGITRVKVIVIRMFSELPFFSIPSRVRMLSLTSSLSVNSTQSLTGVFFLGLRPGVVVVLLVLLEHAPACLWSEGHHIEGICCCQSIRWILVENALKCLW